MDDFKTYFSEEDKTFNKEMVSSSNQESLETFISQNSPFSPRNYDFTSDILDEYKKKHNLS